MGYVFLSLYHVKQIYTDTMKNPITGIEEVTPIEKSIAIMDAVEKFDKFKVDDITIGEVMRIKNFIEETLKHRLK